MDLIEAGKIVGTHGVRGEVKIEPWCDSPEFLREFKVLHISGEARAVLSARIHKTHVLTLFEGIGDPQAAQAIVGKIVYLDRTGVTLPEGRYFVQDLIGLSVIDADGTRVGTLYEVMSMPAHDVYHVKGEDGEHYIPVVPEFVREIDIAAGIVRVSLIEGM